MFRPCWSFFEASPSVDGAIKKETSSAGEAKDDQWYPNFVGDGDCSHGRGRRHSGSGELESRHYSTRQKSILRASLEGWLMVDLLWPRVSTTQPSQFLLTTVDRAAPFLVSRLLLIWILSVATVNNCPASMVKVKDSHWFLMKRPQVFQLSDLANERFADRPLIRTLAKSGMSFLLEGLMERDGGPLWVLIFDECEPQASCSSDVVCRYFFKALRGRR